MPLHPQVVLEPFEQWGSDFVGPINPASQGKNHILICTDCTKKWLIFEFIYNLIGLIMVNIFNSNQ